MEIECLVVEGDDDHSSVLRGYIEYLKLCRQNQFTPPTSFLDDVMELINGSHLLSYCQIHQI